MKERQGDPSTTAPAPNPLMMGMDAGGYVLKALGSVKVSKDALLEFVSIIAHTETAIGCC